MGHINPVRASVMLLVAPVLFCYVKSATKVSKHVENKTKQKDRKQRNLCTALETWLVHEDSEHTFCVQGLARKLTPDIKR